MDPDVLLETIRELSQGLRCAPLLDSANQVAVDGVELAHRINELDHWLTIGGFFPRKWGLRDGAQT